MRYGTSSTSSAIAPAPSTAATSTKRRRAPAMNRMPKPVMNSTEAAPKSGSASSSSAMNTSRPIGLIRPERGGAQLVLAAHRVARDEDQHQHARQLRGLEVEAQQRGSSGGCR